MGLLSEPELDEVQGNVTPGFRKDSQELLFVRFGDNATGARAWLADLLPSVTRARSVAEASRARRLQASASVETGGRAWLNVAFSGQGLRKLDEAKFESLSEPFQQGMVRRAALVRDAPNVIRTWGVRDGPLEDDDGAEKIADAFLHIAADNPNGLDRELQEQTRQLARYGLDQIISYRGQTLGEGREHFGFRDAVSQPAPDDPLSGWDTSDQVVAPGEFVLGCVDERQSETNGPAWAANGSYVAFRRLRQDVEGFRVASYQGAAALVQQGVSPMSPSILRAKLIGRWPSGAKLSAPDGPFGSADPVPGGKPDQEMRQISADDFRQDPLGDGCPLFAHVRNANPRRAGGADAGSRLHRIIRRGITYTRNEGDLGLLFLAYQADIERQFEYIQGQLFWSIGSTGVPGSMASQYPGPDPLVGPTGDDTGERRFLYHRPSAGTADDDFVTLNLQRFVNVTAGGYFFAPSLAAIQMLAKGV